MDQSTSTLTRRLGGPVGRRAIKRGIWFEPAFWVILVAGLVWLIALARQHQCATGFVPGGLRPDPVKAMCYSDIPVYFRADNFAIGADPYFDYHYNQPVLVGLLVVVLRWITRLFHPLSPELETGEMNAGTINEVLAGTAMRSSNLFFALASVVLFLAFMGLVLTHLRLGKDSQSLVKVGARVPSWDAMFIAASPIVMLSGLISWDLLAAALVSLSLYFWATDRTLISGAVLGVALGVRPYPLLIVVGLFVLCARSGRLRVFGGWLTSFATFGLAIQLPVLVASPGAWLDSWQVPNNLGSIWYGLSLVKVRIPSIWVQVISALLIVASLAFLCWLVMAAARRPRLGQVVYLSVLPMALFGVNYSPQTALWLLPLVVLARPNLRDVMIFTTGELIYWFSIWGHLSGMLSLTGYVSALIYPAAIMIRIGTQIWIAAVCLNDFKVPSEDEVRRNWVDDPIGGPLDHTSDVIGARTVVVARRSMEARQSLEVGPNPASSSTSPLASSSSTSESLEVNATDSDFDSNDLGSKDLGSDHFDSERTSDEP